MKFINIFLLQILIISLPAQSKIHPIVTTEKAYVINIQPNLHQKPQSTNKSSQQVLESGAIHIAAQQCPNGGFGWPHNDCSNTYHNITPPIIDGIRQAYKLDSNIGYLGVMSSAGDYDLTSQYNNGEARFGAFTAYQMWNLSQDTNDSIYYDFSETNFFAALEAGTYGENDIDTQGWIESVQTNRTGTWVNLRPWEFSNLVLVAQRHCRNIQSGSFELAIWSGLGTLDHTDPDNVYSDIIGVAGGLLGLARINRMTFPAINAPLHSGVNGIDNLTNLANYLQTLQNLDGSFYWHSNLSNPTDDDKDTQTTAYAIIALIKANERVQGQPYTQAILLGKQWLESMQTNNGGFASFPGDTEHNTEVEGEALTALGTIGIYDRIFLSGMECYVN